MIAYIDSSALLKLAVREPETAALAARVLAYDGLITSWLSVVECRRAARRAAHRGVVRAVDHVLEAVYLVDITAAILEHASQADPPLLRSPDAVHLATALSLQHSELEVVTYDRRLAEVARRYRLSVVSPGVPG